MAVCERYQINRSAFLAWPEEDQDLAIAQEIRHRETCQGCGFHPQDDPDQYDVITERCRICEMTELERDDIPDTERGVKIRVVPIDYAHAQEQQSRLDPFTGKGD